jgi:gliding motility-associated protein GldL
MGKVSKYRHGIGAFISSENGQRFFNFAYSIGAAVVIWGALFKILSIGMGTEVLMFVLTAFDRPPKEYKWEEVFPVLSSKNPEDRPEFGGGGGVYINGGGQGTATGGNVQVSESQAKAAMGIPAGIELSADDSQSLSDSIAKMAAAADQLSRMAELTSATQNYLDQMAGIAEEMQHLRATTEALNNVSDTLLSSYRAITENSENITRSSQGYVEQMQTLNRNITGLNTIYEIQLKSISSQLDSIDRVNRGIKDIRDMYEKSATQSTRYCEETEKMARYMQQLNTVYERMLTAMTVNMYNPMMGVNTPTANNNPAPAEPSASDNL